jgi:hypothetical protein
VSESKVLGGGEEYLNRSERDRERERVKREGENCAVKSFVIVRRVIMEGRR